MSGPHSRKGGGRQAVIGPPPRSPLPRRGTGGEAGALPPHPRSISAKKKGQAAPAGIPGRIGGGSAAGAEQAMAQRTHLG